MSDNDPVWVVNVRDPSHTIRFPTWESAQRWIHYRTPELWRIEPTDTEEDKPGERNRLRT